MCWGPIKFRGKSVKLMHFESFNFPPLYSFIPNSASGKREEKKKMLYGELKKNNQTNQTLFLGINLILHQCKTKSIRLFYHEGDAHICCKWPPSCNTK